MALLVVTLVASQAPATAQEVGTLDFTIVGLVFPPNPGPSVPATCGGASVTVGDTGAVGVSATCAWVSQEDTGVQLEFEQPVPGIPALGTVTWQGAFRTVNSVFLGTSAVATDGSVSVTGWGFGFISGVTGSGAPYLALGLAAVNATFPAGAINP